MKSCFEELRTFLSMRGPFFFLVKTEEGEFIRIVKQLKDFMVKELKFFFMGIYVDTNICD